MNKNVCIRGALVLWVLIVVHLTLIFELCGFINSASSKSSRTAELEEVADDILNSINEKLEAEQEQYNLKAMYSSCNHSWVEKAKSGNGVYITLACDRCGAIQVVNVTKEAIYVNISSN